MNKKKCDHCGYKFTPKDEKETICEPCQIQLKATCSEEHFNVKLLRDGLLNIKGTLTLDNKKIAFEPEEVYFKDKKLEIEVSKICDVRFASQREIEALRVFMLGAVLGALLKKQHNFLLIDYKGENGLIEHLVFEGNNMDLAIKKIRNSL